MLKNRLELAQRLASKEYSYGAEIGVFAGYYSKILCEAMPGLRLLAVDSWAGEWGRTEKQAIMTLAGTNAEIMKKTSVEAARLVPDGTLDFVYIDGAHDYDNVKADIEAWTPKVRKGGVVCGDDYYLTRHGNLGVIQAVNEYAEKHGYNLQTTLWDLSQPHEDDRQPNWWFMK